MASRSRSRIDIGIDINRQRPLFTPALTQPSQQVVDLPVAQVDAALGVGVVAPGIAGNALQPVGMFGARLAA